MQENGTSGLGWILRVFWIVYGSIFILLALKAFTVPITHDEGWTVIQYLDHSVWEIMMYPDEWPNNHIFNTILAKASAAVFGVHDWSVRLPNLLFFWVFAFGVYRFLKTTFKTRMFLFLPAAAIFIISPYFLDFFALCRGYGISSALTMVSLSYFVTGFQRSRQAHIWLAFFLAMLASYANFTVLVYFAAASIVTALFFLVHRSDWLECFKKWGVLFGFMASYAALIYKPILKMKSTNQFEFWTSNGFYEETVFSVIHRSLSDSGVFTRPEWFATLVVILTLGLWMLGGFQLIRLRFQKSILSTPLLVTAMLLFFSVVVNLLQTQILEDPNLNGRTALFLLPLFTSLVAAGLALLPVGKLRSVSLGIGILLVLVTFQHVTVSFRAKSFKEWRYDMYTLEVLSILEQEGGTSKLRVDWLYQNSFEFYAKYEPSDSWKLFVNNDDMEVDPKAEVDYYYVSSESVRLLKSQFEVVKTFEQGQTLMRKR